MGWGYLSAEKADVKDTRQFAHRLYTPYEPPFKSPKGCPRQDPEEFLL